MIKQPIYRPFLVAALLIANVTATYAANEIPAASAIVTTRSAPYLTTDFADNRIVVTDCAVNSVGARSAAVAYAGAITVPFAPVQTAPMSHSATSCNYGVSVAKAPVLVVVSGDTPAVRVIGRDITPSPKTAKFAGMDIVVNPGDTGAWRNPWYKRLANRTTLIFGLGALFPGILLFSLRRSLRD